MVFNNDIIDMKVKEIKQNNIISNELAKKIANKEFSLQFLPECFDNIKDEKYVNFKGEKLKTSYLIDIVNNLILKYYFKRENKYALNSLVLKDKYGYLYNYYINYLVSSNILILKTNHKKGVSSRIYSLNEKIFKTTIKRYRNFDKVLLKKYKKKIFDSIDFSESTSNNLIDIEIKERLISDLYGVKIDTNKSLIFMDMLAEKDYDVYNRNLYSIDCINDKHIFYHFDNYGRFHTNYTILRSFIRKNCLLMDGEETCEIDISNSQPLFLSKLINDSSSSWVKKKEFEIFKYMTKNGLYYKYLQQELNIKDKSEVKNLTYKVLFGRNSHNSKADKLFKSLFPTIHNFIVLYKKEHGDYKVLAYKLQKMESNLIFNKIIKKIYNNHDSVKVITVHDSIIIQKKWRDVVYSIFRKELLSEFDF
jgi:hypothetical protein